MKTKLATLFIVTFFMGAPMIAQSGTDAGGGGGGNDEKYLPHDHPDDEKSRDAARDANGNERPEFYLSEWCTATKAILRDYKQYARLTRGGYAEARKTLVEGLYVVLGNYERPDQKMSFELLTVRSINRALMINDILSDKGDELENQVVATLLSHFYNFIIDVNVSFDQNYVIPYFHHHHCYWDRDCADCRQAQPCNRHRHHASCPYKEVTDDNFYTEYGKYVVKLLSFSLERMEALGSNHLELLFMENITGWASEDLASSVFRRRYECVRTILWNLNQIIHNFLGGRRGYFPDSRMLTMHGRERVAEAKEILRDLEYGKHRHGPHCYGGR